jgi:hypothetical protein
VPGATIEDWKDCGQCRDCFNPSFSMRPKGAVQYIVSLTNFDDPSDPRRFRFGFIASSDNHTARPGTGYKEYGRRMMTEAAGPRDETWARRLFPAPGKPKPESVRFDPATLENAFLATDLERQAWFFMTGGIVAAHSSGRDRNSIWDALKRREVYGTSGERILLWFDLLNGPNGGEQPMGSEVAMQDAQLNYLRGAFVNHARTGQPQERGRAGFGPPVPPNDIFPCKPGGPNDWAAGVWPISQRQMLPMPKIKITKPISPPR